jgi:hypothetical protein
MFDALEAFEIGIAVIAGLVHGIFGFGFPIVATPLFALFMDLKNAVLYTLFPTIATNVLSLKKENTFGAIWREYGLLIISVIVGSLIGTNLLILYNSPYYKLILAAVILLYLTKARLNISMTSLIQEHRQTMIVAMGCLSGFIGGISNIMVPVLVILLLELHLEKKRLIGVMNFCFIANKSLQVVIFGMHGSFGDNLFVIVLLVAASIIGFALGSRVHDKIDERVYKKLLHAVLWILSFYLIFDVFHVT